MKKEWFFRLLRDPQSGQPLAALADDAVPTFVDPAPAALAQGFNYAAHYATDAVEFDYFEEYTDRLTAAHLNLLRTTVMKTVPADADLLLDVGCGSAFVASHFCPKGRHVVSMDIAPANVRKALERFPFDNHAGVVADAFRLPFADGTFDCIIASEIIEHTVDPQTFLVSLCSKLKPGGTLIVSTPYMERIAYSLCIHCNCKTPHNAHLHSFDKPRMQKLAAALPARIDSMRLVGNKLLLRTHLSMLFSHLGYSLWSLLDRLANRLLPRAEHFVIKIVKNK